MKKILLAATALLGLAANNAGAADLAVRPVLRAPVANCPAAWFQGWYIGANAGSASWTGYRRDNDGFALPLQNIDFTNGFANKQFVGHKNAFIGGGQIGYNWTRCNTLFGLEVQGDWGSASSSNTFSTLNPNFAAPGAVAAATVDSRFNGIVTFKARSGIVLDNLLLYVTGGLATGHFRTTYSTFTNQAALAQAFGADAPGAPFAATFEDNQWRWGWVAGFGAEYAYTDRISIKSETLYADFSERTRNHAVAFPASIAAATGVPGRSFSFTNSDSVWISKIGINVKLDPVVGRAY